MVYLKMYKDFLIIMTECLHLYSCLNIGFTIKILHFMLEFVIGHMLISSNYVQETNMHA